jgi:Flp pilus assembly protein TadG
MTTVRRLLPARLLHDRRGVATVEFAFATILLVMFMVGILEFGRALWTQNVLGFAVEQAGRYVIAYPAAADDDIKGYVATQLHNVDVSAVTVTVARDTAGGVNYVTVTARTPFTSVAPFVESALLNLSSSSRVPIGT